MTQRAPNVTAALLWMSGSLISFSLVAISGRGAHAAGVDTMHLMMLRSVVALVVLALVQPLTARGFRQLWTRTPALHGLRNLLHFGAQYSWFTALSLISLAQLFALEFTAPLWVAILAPLFLSEKLTAPRIAAAAIGFVGVLVVVRPTSAGLGDGAIYALLAALGFASSMVVTRALVRNDTVLCFLFHMAWSQALLAALLLGGRIMLPSMEGLFWCTMVGLAGLAAHFSLARAFVHADAIIVAPMDFLRLPLIAIVGIAFYGEPFDAIVFLGGGIVVLANLINIWFESRRRRAATTA
ncbi:MAG: DMT family transporter [Hyphomicrobiaceae bacterium]|nr:DMT family transporter [Hyphomicrobiaceae bacterium]